MKNPIEISSSIKHRAGHWVQTERAAHESWAKLSMRSPKASALMHHLVANMGGQNAVVISQKTLAKLMGCHLETIKRALAILVAERWVQIVRIGKGKEAAYVVNDRVAWGQSRDKLCLSTFSATIIADHEDQDTATLDHTDLRKIPVLYPGEMQLPTGDHDDPPSQPIFEGMEPNLPALNSDFEIRKKLEENGQKRLDE